MLIERGLLQPDSNSTCEIEIIDIQYRTDIDTTTR
jgi:hypothetical protein